MVRVGFEWALFVWKVTGRGRVVFMNGDSDIYFTHANALSSAFFGVRNDYCRNRSPGRRFFRIYGRHALSAAIRL